MSDLSLLDDRQTVEHIAQRLRAEFAGIYSNETIERVVAESLDSQKNARIKTYIVLFAERFARERLHAAANPAMNWCGRAGSRCGPGRRGLWARTA